MEYLVAWLALCIIPIVGIVLIARSWKNRLPKGRRKKKLVAGLIVFTLWLVVASVAVVGNALGAQNQAEGTERNAFAQTITAHVESDAWDEDSSPIGLCVNTSTTDGIIQNTDPIQSLVKVDSDTGNAVVDVSPESKEVTIDLALPDEPIKINLEPETDYVLMSDASLWSVDAVRFKTATGQEWSDGEDASESGAESEAAPSPITDIVIPLHEVDYAQTDHGSCRAWIDKAATYIESKGEPDKASALKTAALAALDSAQNTKQVAQSAEGELKVHFIDVGQGDSAFIELPDGKTMLIDAGTRASSGVVKGYVDALGYDRIDYVVATHPHEDHIGGLPVVLRSFDVGAVFAPKAQANTRIFEEFLDTVEDKGLEITTAYKGRSIDEKALASGDKKGDESAAGKNSTSTSTSGNSSSKSSKESSGSKDALDSDDYKITILSPYQYSNPEDLNDASVVIRLEYGKASFLFTGDAGSDILSSAVYQPCSVLKVSHHGSRTGTTKSLVKTLKPGAAIISVGVDNSYGHPSQQVLEALEDTKVYRTDKNGTIIATTTGDEVRIVTSSK